MNYTIQLADDGFWELTENDELIAFSRSWDEFLEYYYKFTGIVPTLLDEDGDEYRTLLNYDSKPGRYSYEYEVADAYMEDVDVNEYVTFTNPFKNKKQAYQYCTDRKRLYNRHFSIKHNDDGTVTMKRYA